MDRGNNERDILAPLRNHRASHKSGVMLGIGDDCAVFRPRSGEDLVFTTDFSIEDIHFRFATHTAAQIGHNALGRGLSDIAAMGARARFCLVSLAVPSYADRGWIRGFYRGLLALADCYSVALAGGDLSTADKIHCDIVVCGALPAGSALRRGGARPGDAIYVSGALGGSALGLECRRGAAWKRHLRIEPRLRLGEFLRTRLKATACMDLSDGLSLDLSRLCQESVVSAEIGMPPTFPGASAGQALHGGEDYELLFTTSPRKKVPSEFEGLSLNRIGVITAGHTGRIVMDGKVLRAAGFDHFRKRVSDSVA